MYLQIIFINNSVTNGLKKRKKKHCKMALYGKIRKRDGK